MLDVMLPAYGDDVWVRQAIISVREQDDPRWRLTVLDDGPAAGRDPGLADWLRELDDDRIRYQAHSQRLGINRNFQRCVDASAADLVVILGADDRLLPDFAGRVHQVAEQFPGAAFIHTGARIVDGAGTPVLPLVDRVKRLSSIRAVSSPRETGGQRLAASLLRGNWMYFPSVVFRRGWLVEHGFRPGYEVVQDLDLYLRILRAGGSVVLLDRPGIEYRRHAASVSSAGAVDGTRFAEERRFFAEAAADMARAGWPGAARAARWHLTSRLHALVKVAGLVAGGDWPVAGRMLRETLAPLPPSAPTSAGSAPVLPGDHGAATR